MPDHPLVLDHSTRQHGLQMAVTARALVLIAHPDRATRSQPGQGFVADVLHANGFATLSFCMQTPAEEAAGRPPGMVQSKQRLRELFDWLGQQPALEQRPVALVGLGDAAPACIAAAARHSLAGLRSLVLLDARADKVSHHLNRLNLPTLFVLGRSDARTQARHRAATRDMPAGHRLDVLKLATLPSPAPGALEAFACSALEWLTQGLASARRPADRFSLQRSPADESPAPTPSRQRRAGTA